MLNEVVRSSVAAISASLPTSLLSRRVRVTWLFSVTTCLDFVKHNLLDTKEFAVHLAKANKEASLKEILVLL